MQHKFNYLKFVQYLTIGWRASKSLQGNQNWSDVILHEFLSLQKGNVVSYNLI